MSITTGNFPTGLALTTDFGDTWTCIGSPGYPNCQIETGNTGGFDIKGLGNMTVMQACGLSRSYDGGKTWTSIGGPVGLEPQRILIPPRCQGAVIIAFGVTDSASDRGAWMTTDGGDGTIPLPGDTLTILPPKFDSVFACDTTRLPLFFANCGCTPADYHFDSVVVSNDALGQFSIQNRKLFPKQWDGFASRDTLWVSYAPNFRIGSSRAQIHLYGGIIRDSTITPFDSLVPLFAYAKAEALSVIPSEDSVNLGKINLCLGGIDTLVRITNRSCGSVLIDSSWTVGSEFDLSSIALPFVLGHDSSIVVRIHSLPSSPGVKTETLHFHASSGGATETITVTLLATGIKSSSALMLSRSTVDFGLQSLCALDSVRIGLLARGCDTLRLDSVRYSGDVDFSTGSIGTLVSPFDSAHAVVYLHPATPGAHSGRVTLFSHDVRDGSEHDTTLKIAANVSAPGREIATTSTTLHPMTLCNVDSTLITVANTGCDTLLFDPAQLQGAGYSFTTSGPTTVAPGGSIRYVVRLRPVSKGIQSGSLGITAHDVRSGVAIQDTLINLSALVLDGNRYITIDSTLRDFGTGSFCRRTDTTIIFKNTGCDSVTVSSITIGGSNSMTISGRTTPFTLAPDSTTSILVQYSPTSTGQDGATVTISTNADQSATVHIPIRAESIGPQSLTLATSVTQSSIYAGDTTTVFVTPDRTVSVSGLKTLSFSVQYDGDLLTYVSARSLSGGFSLGPISESRNGNHSVLTLTLNAMPSQTLFAVSQPLVALKLRTTLSDSARTPISIGDIKLNDGDPVFTACALTISDSASSFMVALNCGDSTISDFMRHRTLVLSAQPAYPNPITSASAFMATIPFTTTSTGVAQITILDVTGRMVLNEDQEVSYPGRHFFYFSGERLPAGKYFYQITFPKGGEVIVDRTMILVK